MGMIIMTFLPQPVMNCDVSLAMGTILHRLDTLFCFVLEWMSWTFGVVNGCYSTFYFEKPFKIGTFAGSFSLPFRN